MLINMFYKMFFRETSRRMMVIAATINKACIVLPASIAKKPTAQIMIKKIAMT